MDLYVEDGGRGHPGRAAARADGDAPLRGDGLQGARALRAPRDRLRRARARAQRSGARAGRLPLRGPRRPTCARVLDERGIERAVLAGASMGAHTLLRFALEHPERAAALVVITPAYDPVDNDDPTRLARWDALADGPARAAASRASSRPTAIPACPRRGARRCSRCCASAWARHEHPEAVADALRAVPRSRPFGTLHDLAAIEAPTVDRGRPRRGRPRAPAERGGGLRARHPGRAAGGRGAGPLADRVAGRPAVEGHRGGRRGGGAARPRPLGLSRPGVSPAVSCAGASRPPPPRA